MGSGLTAAPFHDCLEHAKNTCDVIEIIAELVNE
jgi:hypothetical protein